MLSGKEEEHGESSEDQVHEVHFGVESSVVLQTGDRLVEDGAVEEAAILEYANK